ncbi:MAG: hypothetical protein WCC06_10305 [Candidatus Aminicenantales bacterium]
MKTIPAVLAVLFVLASGGYSQMFSFKITKENRNMTVFLLDELLEYVPAEAE